MSFFCLFVRVSLLDVTITLLCVFLTVFIKFLYNKEKLPPGYSDYFIQYYAVPYYLLYKK